MKTGLRSQLAQKARKKQTNYSMGYQLVEVLKGKLVTAHGVLTLEFSEINMALNGLWNLTRINTMLMNITLEPKKNTLLLRLASMMLILAFTPFGIMGMLKEGKGYGIIFFIAFLVALLPELYVKLFRKPVSAVLLDTHIIAKYYRGDIRQVYLDEIAGYSATIEQTNYGKRKGVLLYLKDGKRVDFTEINIKDSMPLISYLDSNNVPCYGSEKLGAWYLSKYRYDTKI